MASTDLPSFMRVEAVAEALSVSRRTVFELISSGRLAAYKLGGATLVRRADLSAYAASLPQVRTKYAA